MKAILVIVAASLTFAVFAAKATKNGIEDAASKRAAAIEKVVRS